MCRGACLGVAVLALLVLLPSCAGRVTSRYLGPDQLEQTELCAPCTCNLTSRVAICENLNLTYIPLLPSGITELNFEGNVLQRLTNTTFQNITHLALTILNLYSNNIHEISHDAFQQLNTSELRIINIQRNTIDAQNLAEALKVIGKFPQLQVLNLMYIGLRVLPKNFLEGLKGSGIQSLWLSDNHIVDIQVEDFVSMPSLRNLSLRGNLFLSFRTNLTSKTNITHLKLAYNVLQTIPSFCDGTNMFPELLYLGLAYNRIFSSEDLSCLTNLKHIDLSGNQLLYLDPNMVMGLRSLHVVLLTYMQQLGNKPRQWAASAFNNSWVYEVNMINSGIRIGHDHFSADIFQGCDNLTRLYLGENTLSQASDEFFERLFQPILGLRFLDLSSSGLTTIPKAVSKLRYLEEIWLFSNYIVRWESEIFLHLTCLANISMSHNQITQVDEDSFPSTLVNNLRALNLSENPFSCTCDLLWFLQWMDANTTIFTGNHDNYSCGSPHNYAGRRLLDLHVTQTTCLFGQQDLVLIIVVLSILLFFAVVCPLVFRYRWHLQSAVFLIRYQTLREERRRAQREYEFDAFLIYSETDSRRVRQEFLPRLEQDHGLHLCVHERDFRAGKAIVDNIVDSMLASRLVVVLLSNALATSEWCQFELNLAHTEVLESGAAPLVLLLLEDIVPHNMTPTLYAVLKTTTYLRYPDLPRDAEAFWHHVHRVLADLH